MYDSLIRGAEEAEFRGDELFARGRVREADAAWESAVELYELAERSRSASNPVPVVAVAATR